MQNQTAYMYSTAQHRIGQQILSLSSYSPPIAVVRGRMCIYLDGTGGLPGRLRSPSFNQGTESCTTEGCLLRTPLGLRSKTSTSTSTSPPPHLTKRHGQQYREEQTLANPPRSVQCDSRVAACNAWNVYIHLISLRVVSGKQGT